MGFQFLFREPFEAAGGFDRRSVAENIAEEFFQKAHRRSRSWGDSGRFGLAWAARWHARSSSARKMSRKLLRCRKSRLRILRPGEPGRGKFQLSSGRRPGRDGISLLATAPTHSNWAVGGRLEKPVCDPKVSVAPVGCDRQSGDWRDLEKSAEPSRKRADWGDLARDKVTPASTASVGRKVDFVRHGQLVARRHKPDVQAKDREHSFALVLHCASGMYFTFAGASGLYFYEVRQPASKTAIAAPSGFRLLLSSDTGFATSAGTVQRWTAKRGHLAKSRLRLVGCATY